MKAYSIIILTALLALFATSCDDLTDKVCENGEGFAETKTLTLPAFTGIILKNAVDVELTQGSTQSVEVTGEENLIDLLTLDVENDIWTIDFSKCIRNMDDMTIRITLPELDFVEVDGSGDVKGIGTFRTSNFIARIDGSGDVVLSIIADAATLEIDGSGDMDIDVEADRLTTSIKGSGDMQIEGLANINDISVRGSGDLYAFNLETSDTEVDVNGSGDVQVLANDNLDVDIDGSGSVYYRGKPSISFRIDGSGEIVDAN